MIHRTASCRGLKTEVPKGVAQQYLAQHPPIMSDLHAPADERNGPHDRA
jgi:hypothetical protein